MFLFRRSSFRSCSLVRFVFFRSSGSFFVRPVRCTSVQRKNIFLYFTLAKIRKELIMAKEISIKTAIREIECCRVLTISDTPSSQNNDGRLESSLCSSCRSLPMIRYGIVLVCMFAEYDTDRCFFMVAAVIIVQNTQIGTQLCKVSNLEATIL